MPSNERGCKCHCSCYCCLHCCKPQRCLQLAGYAVGGRDRLTDRQTERQAYAQSARQLDRQVEVLESPLIFLSIKQILKALRLAMPGTRHESPYKGTLDKLTGRRKANGMRTSSRLWGNETQMNSSMQRGVVSYYMQSIFGPERVSSTFRSTMQISGSAAK